MKISIFKKIFLFLSITIHFSVFSITNKTFFMPRPIGQDAVFQNISDLYFIDSSEKSKDYVPVDKNNILFTKIEPEHLISPIFNLTNILFYEESTNGKDLAKYFFPNDKTELVIKGYAVPGSKDIAAEWLRIASSAGNRNDENNYLFQSKISVSPRQTRFGNIIKLHKRLDCINKKLWFQVFFPIIQVETNAHLNEYDKQNERIDGKWDFPEPYNAAGALNSPLMLYGKITNHTQKLSGLAEIDLKFGFKLIKELSIYAKCVFPTSFKPKSEYLFEPILGNGGHWGLGLGANLNLKISEDFNFLSNFDYVYLFKNNEKRSFDLISSGPWSRYLLATNGSVRQRPLPLINFLTQDLDVTPGSSLSWTGAVNYHQDSFNLEAGYSFWFKEQEKVNLKYAWKEKIGIAYFEEGSAFDFDASYEGSYLNAGVRNPEISSPLIIPDPYPFLAVPRIDYIESSDFDLVSAKHLQTVSHKFYLALGFDGKWEDAFFQGKLGCSYEFGINNKSLDLWGLWGQVSLYF